MWTARILRDAALVQAIETLKESGYRFNNGESTFYVMEPAKQYAEKFSNERLFVTYLQEKYRKLHGADRDRSNRGKAPKDARDEVGNPRQEANQQGGHTAERIAVLERQIGEFQSALASALRDVEQWKAKAGRAEARIRDLEEERAARECSGSIGGEDRYRKLRSLLAREFHPDYNKSEGIEKIIRTEIFKEIWPKIQSIE